MRIEAPASHVEASNSRRCQYEALLVLKIIKSVWIGETTDPKPLIKSNDCGRDLHCKWSQDFLRENRNLCMIIVTCAIQRCVTRKVLLSDIIQHARCKNWEIIEKIAVCEITDSVCAIRIVYTTCRLFVHLRKVSVVPFHSVFVRFP